MRKFLNKLIPRSFAAWSLTAIAAGILCGAVFGPRCAVLNPLGEIFVRAYALVLLPYLIFEIIGIFGGLRRESLVALVRNGGLTLIGMLLLGGATVALLPLMLPQLLSSPLFDPDILEARHPESLIEVFLPSNIFAAMAKGNVPPVMFFSIVIGIILQKMKNREPILELIEPLRRLFTEIFSFVAKKVAPFGIFAFTANAVGNAQGGDLERLLGLLAMLVVGFIILGFIILPGIVSTLTPYRLPQMWSVLRDPLILVISTGNILMAMPLVIEGLRRVLVDEAKDEDRNGSDFAVVEALVPICFTMLGIGRNLLMVIFPFLAWFHDTPLSTVEIIRHIPSIFASAMGGAQAALLMELPRLGLPVNLLSIYLINSQWILRICEPLSLIGTMTVAFVLFATMNRRLVFRPGRAVLVCVAAVSISLFLGTACHRILASQLKGFAHSREIVLFRQSLLDLPKPTILSKENLPAPAPVSLDAIKQRGVLRVGVKSDSVPWVYRNQSGDLVGYDVDLLASLAEYLQVRLDLLEGSPAELKQWLLQGRIDCAAGGLHGTGLATIGDLFYLRYEKATLAALVSDKGVRRMQDAIASKNSQTLRFASQGRQEISPALHRSVETLLSEGKNHKHAVFLPIQSKEEFLSGMDEKFDALLTTAEAGSAYAVIHPETTMLPIFGTTLSSDIVLVFPKTDDALLDYVSDWIVENQNLDLLERLRNHWILFKPTK